MNNTKKNLFIKNLFLSYLLDFSLNNLSYFINFVFGLCWISLFGLNSVFDHPTFQFLHLLFALEAGCRLDSVPAGSWIQLGRCRFLRRPSARAEAPWDHAHARLADVTMRMTIPAVIIHWTFYGTPCILSASPILAWHGVIK